MAELHIEAATHTALLAHLLPLGNELEHATFLFAKREADSDRFDVVDMMPMTRADLAVQERDYLELTDQARIRVIKHAHALGASVVETHSHPFPLPAAFSYPDRRGLRETVPQMWWRLAKRPYFAIVVGPFDFDALAWLDNSATPGPLAALVAGDRRLVPTNNSLGGW